MQERTETSVRLFDDHRDNLAIDVHNEIVRARAAEMRSEHSESALLWNVFRTLQGIDARLWLPRVVRYTLAGIDRDALISSLVAPTRLETVEFHWWRRWELPETRLEWLHEAALSGSLRLDHYAPRSTPEKKAEIERRLGAGLPFEEPVEIPLCVETPDLLVAFEVVFKGNLRRHTTYDSHRDAILRLLDAGTHAASRHGKRFATVILCADPRLLNLETARLVERYRGRPDRLAEALPHRNDRDVLAAAASAVGMLRWRDLGALLVAAKAEERLGLFDTTTLDELIKYLGRKDLGFNFFRRLK